MSLSVVEGICQDLCIDCQESNGCMSCMREQGRPGTTARPPFVGVEERIRRIGISPSPAQLILGICMARSD